MSQFGKPRSRMAWKQRKHLVTKEISRSEAQKEGIEVFDEQENKVRPVREGHFLAPTDVMNSSVPEEGHAFYVEARKFNTEERRQMHDDGTVYNYKTFAIKDGEEVRA